MHINVEEKEESINTIECLENYKVHRLLPDHLERGQGNIIRDEKALGYNRVASRWKEIYFNVMTKIFCWNAAMF